MKELLQQILSQLEFDNIYPETQEKIKEVLDNDQTQSKKV